MKTLRSVKNVPEETEEQKDSRARLCLEEIAKVLIKHNCEIEPVGTISAKKGIELGFNINAK